MSEPKDLLSRRALVALLAVLTILPWLNSFAGGYVFDDSREIEQSSRIRNFTPLARHFRGQRPLQSLSLTLNYKISKFDTWSYHLFNLLIHLVSVLTLFVLVRGCLEVWSERPSWLPPPAYLAFASALLWGAHPLQTESVTYIVQRAESMMGMFYLLGLWAVLWACREQKIIRGFGLAAIFGALGMLTKIVIGSLPMVALCMDRLFFANSFRETLKKRWLGHLILWGIWIVPLSTGLLKKLTVGVSSNETSPAIDGLDASSLLGGEVAQTVSAGLSTDHISKLDYLFSQAEVLLHYVKMTLWPTNQTLDYNWQVVGSISEVILPGLVILTAIGLGIFLLWKGRRISFLILSFFLILSPTSSFIPLFDLCAEHRMYLSSAAVIVLLILGFCRVATKLGWSGKVNVAVLCSVYVTLAALTFQRNTLYADEASMWQQVLEVRPDNARAHYQLGCIAYAAKDFEEARRRCNRSIDLAPGFGLNFILLSQLEHHARRYDRALLAAKNAAITLPNLSAAWNLYGGALYQNGRYDQAILAFKKAGLIDPGLPLSHRKRAQTFIKLGNLYEARRAIRRAFYEGEDSADGFAVLAVLDKLEGCPKDALSNFDRAFERQDDDPEIWLNHSLLLESLGRFQKALASAEKAYQLDDNLARAAFQIALMRDRAADYDGAVRGFDSFLNRHGAQNASLSKAARWLRQQAKEKSELTLAQVRGALRQTPLPPSQKLVLMAEYAVAKKEWKLAVALYQVAFRADEQLANDLSRSYRYNAVIAAVRANEFSQAWDWLNADFSIRSAQLKAGGRTSQASRGALKRWLIEPAFDALRDPSRSAPWPEFWRKLKAMVDSFES